MKVHDSKCYRWFLVHLIVLFIARIKPVKEYEIFKENIYFIKMEEDQSVFYNVTLYINSILNQSALNIFLSLLEFKISINLCNCVASLYARQNHYSPELIFESFNRSKKEILEI